MKFSEFKTCPRVHREPRSITSDYGDVLKQWRTQGSEDWSQLVQEQSCRRRRLMFHKYSKTNGNITGQNKIYNQKGEQAYSFWMVWNRADLNGSLLIGLNHKQCFGRRRWPLYVLSEMPRTGPWTQFIHTYMISVLEVGEFLGVCVAFHSHALS